MGKVDYDLSGGLDSKTPKRMSLGTGTHQSELLGAQSELPELFGENLPGAELVACGGCCATAAQLAGTRAIHTEATGRPGDALGAFRTSGAGRKADLSLSFTMVSGNLKAYRVGHHQHVPEIQTL